MVYTFALRSKVRGYWLRSIEHSFNNQWETAPESKRKRWWVKKKKMYSWSSSKILKNKYTLYHIIQAKPILSWKGRNK